MFLTFLSLTKIARGAPVSNFMRFLLFGNVHKRIDRPFPQISRFRLRIRNSGYASDVDHDELSYRFPNFMRFEYGWVITSHIANELVMEICSSCSRCKELKSTEQRGISIENGCIRSTRI